MTEQAPENDMWDGEDGTPAAPGGVAYPEQPDNPHEAPLSVNFKPGGTPQLTVRGRTVAEHMELLKAVESSGLLGVIASVNAAFGGQGPAPQAPAQGFPQPPQGVNYNPQMPPPNQPFPGQPAWQQAGAPQAQGWGGAPQGGGSGLPAGWYRLTVPFQQKATFDGIVTQFGLKKGDPFKGGQVSWRKEQKFWACAPEVAQAFAQFNPVAA